MELGGGLPPVFSISIVIVYNSLKSIPRKPCKRTKSRIYIYTLNVKSKCQGTTQPYWKSDLKSPKVQLYIVQKWMHHVHFPSNQIIFFLLLAKGTTKGSALLITFLCYPSHFLLNFGKKIFWKDLDNNSPNIDNRCRLYSIGISFEAKSLEQF